jgi:hypothetical protein
MVMGRYRYRINVRSFFYQRFVRKLFKFRDRIKGIVQPFELGGETRLIRSAVKYWKPGKFLKFF